MQLTCFSVNNKDEALGLAQRVSNNEVKFCDLKIACTCLEIFLEKNQGIQFSVRYFIQKAIEKYDENNYWVDDCAKDLKIQLY